MKASRQTTLAESVSLSGAGVHCNTPVSITVHPALENTGIVFLRTGLPEGEEVIPALWTHVTTTALCTVIGNHNGASVSTVEHLLSAFAGLGVDNAIVEIDGPEAPIMDGSASPFVAAIDQAGVCELSAPRRFLRILKTVRVENGRAFSELRPSSTSGLRLEVEIHFPTPLIGRQKSALQLDASAFRRELARARTFGFLGDVEKLWKAGFALGASLENTVAMDDVRILNPEGLRFGDEFVRHKTLDAVGDLALAGAPILGTYRSYCGGHRMNVAVLEALFADSNAYEWVETPRVRGGHAELRAAAAAFAPDRT
jgi:UDP-3-O-[3-hydroxymyristoyl] N-acetylglucosamine deacetylase